MPEAPFLRERDGYAEFSDVAPSCGVAVGAWQNRGIGIAAMISAKMLPIPIGRGSGSAAVDGAGPAQPIESYAPWKTTSRESMTVDRWPMSFGPPRIPISGFTGDPR
jgi:hypothetical protein